MSEENVEIVRRGFEAFSRGGEEAQASEAMLAPDVVWEVALGVSDFDGVYRGTAAVRRFWRKFLTEFDDVSIEVEELIDCGERVFSASRLGGRGRHSGVQVATPMVFQVFTLRDGLIVGYQLHAERQKALEAAGLEE